MVLVQRHARCNHSRQPGLNRLSCRGSANLRSQHAPRRICARGYRCLVIALQNDTSRLNRGVYLRRCCMPRI